MKNNPAIEFTVYALAILLSLATMWLVLNAPANYLDSHAVYQAF